VIFLTIEWLQLLEEYRGVLVPPDIEEVLRSPNVMTESELRAELLYSFRPPRCCEFDAAWRARSAPRSYMMQEHIRKESPGLHQL
jgi:hypothetical protein